MPGLTDRRIGLLFLVFAAALAAATLRAGWLGAVRAPALKQAAATQQVQEIRLPAPRGTITDRHGAVLAVSEPASDVSATPYLVREPLRAAAALGPLLGVPSGEVLAKLSEQTGFVYLARRLPAARADRIAALRIDGIALTPSTLRTYPRSWLAAQVLGSASEDPGGGTGLEYGQDDLLRGRDGLRRIVNDALGEPISIKDERPTVAGKDLELTLDAPLQEKVESVLQGIGQVYKPARGATAIVMNPQTSEILALANWPRVNANEPGGAPAWATQNRAVGLNFEPGSTFKAFTVAGALEDRAVTPDKPFFLPAAFTLYDRTLHDSHPRGDVTLTVRQILAQSSNVGAVKIALEIGARRFSQWVDLFGFGRPTRVALPGEEIGIVPTYRDYSGTSILNLPIGQGESVTPMQLTAAYAAIANGGILRTPQMIRSIGGRPVRAPAGRRIVSEATAASVREMLRGVLAAGGTASDAQIDGYDLAGKTGTANKVDPDGEYSETRYIASFVGFAPARDPQLLVSVVVDEPQGAIYGGQVAGPAFQKIVAFALPYLGIRPS